MNSERLIHPPPRTSRFGAVIISSVALVYSLAAFFPAVRPVAALLALLVLFLALLRKEPEAALPALLVLLIVAAPFLHPLLSRWPWGLLVPALCWMVLTLSFPDLRSRFGWARPGSIDTGTALLIALTILCSAVALFLWERTLKPDLSLHLASFPAGPAWFFPIAGIGFSIGNAALEEFVFRGAIMRATDSAYGAGLGSVLVQAWLFGAAHFLRGFPNGWWGLALATAYGVMLGILRRRSKGMLAPWTAHAGADLVIFMILASRAAG